MRCIEVVGVRRERLSYDKNGNITKLKRYGDSDDVSYAFVIDDLQYTYDTTNKNRLLKVTDYSSVPQGFKDDSNGISDPEDDYKYDANGNMTADQNKGIETITYNHLNLPVMIKIPGSGQISYLYNAAGTKVRKIVSTNSEIITDYMAGGFQYHNTKLKHFPHPEGYVTIVDDKFRYVYNYTDHLGNVRLSYSDANANGTIDSNEIMEENNYYPFGLKHTAYNTNQSQYVSSAQLNQITLEVMPHYEGDGSYQYKYNGKEYQDELGLNMYDYGARNYDPALGRWMNIDPLAEQMRRFSPYNYAYNNPVYFIDPDGMAPEIGHENNTWESTFINETGKVVEYRDDGDDNVYLVDDNWKKGSSKEGLAVLGKEKSGMTYSEGLTYQFNKNGELDYFNSENIKKSSGEITPIGGAFDIFGAWEIFWNGVFELVNSDNDPYVSLAFAIVTKGKSKPWINRKLYNSLGPNLAKKFVAAIENGIVSPTGRQGIIKLTKTEMTTVGGNYTHKLKILGQGGDLRIYGYQLPNGQFVFDKIMGH